MRKIITAFAAMLLAAPAMAHGRHWQVVLANAPVVSTARLERLSGDSLVVAGPGGMRSIPADSIIEVRLIARGSFWKGFRTGAIVGGLVGAAGGAVFSKPGGLMAKDPAVYRPVSAVGVGLALGLLGGTIGGTATASAGVDEVHDLSGLPLPEKLIRLRRILDGNGSR